MQLSNVYSSTQSHSQTKGPGIVKVGGGGGGGGWGGGYIVFYPKLFLAPYSIASLFFRYPPSIMLNDLRPRLSYIRPKW